MKKWEYAVVNLSDVYHDEVSDTLNKYGIEYWELVSMSFDKCGNFHTAVFKRELSE